MAKVIYGGGVSAIQGKIGGTVHARTRGGPSMRNKTKPNNPATPAQQAQRAQLARLSGAWRALTEAQRKAWNEEAKQTIRKGVCGNIINVTGHQLFVRVNSLRESNGDGAAASTPPGAAEFGENVFGDFDDFSCAAGAVNVLVPLGTGGVENVRVAIWATAARSAGKAAYAGVMKKTYEAAITADQETASEIDISAEWTNLFGPMTGTAGKAITVGAREYNEGNYSPSIIFQAVIQA
jgi:hypothetical protein